MKAAAGKKVNRPEWGVLELLEGKPYGMTGTAIMDALGITEDTKRRRLWTLEKEGLVCRAGGGSVVVWGLAKYQPTIKAAHSLKVASRKRRRRAIRAKQGKERRALQAKQKLVAAGSKKPLPFQRPAVNSVWSLAA